MQTVRDIGTRFFVSDGQENFNCQNFFAISDLDWLTGDQSKTGDFRTNCQMFPRAKLPQWLCKNRFPISLTVWFSEGASIKKSHLSDQSKVLAFYTYKPLISRVDNFYEGLYYHWEFFKIVQTIIIARNIRYKYVKTNNKNSKTLKKCNIFIEIYKILCLNTSKQKYVKIVI